MRLPPHVWPKHASCARLEQTDLRPGFQAHLLAVAQCTQARRDYKFKGDCAGDGDMCLWDRK